MGKLVLWTILLGTAASAAQAAPATGLSAGCAELNGFTAALLEVRVDEVITERPLAAGEVVTIRGTAMTQQGNQPSDGWYVSDPVAANPGSFGFAPLSPVYGPTAFAFLQTFVVPVAGMLSFGISETGPVYTDIENFALTCTLPALDLTIVKVTRAAQGRSIISSLQRNYATRFGGAPVADGTFVSTKGGKDGVNVWAAITGRTFWDGYDGNSVGLTFGADRFVGAQTLVGLMAGRNQQKITDASGVDNNSSANMLGVYAAHAIGDTVVMDGYVARSWVGYDVDGTEFDTGRTLVGLSATGRIENAAGVLQPRARVDASRESFPESVSGLTAGRAEAATASVGARFDWNTPLGASGLKPFASLDVEWNYARDTDDVVSHFTAPRLGLGVTGQVGQGELTAALDLGRVAEDVNDAGLTLSYDLRF
jgi:hypothetical protein